MTRTWDSAASKSDADMSSSGKWSSMRISNGKAEAASEQSANFISSLTAASTPVLVVTPKTCDLEQWV
eukprot:CAMPEP_0175866638 /NCGR_PEP_ID=MMETSP0107_2-20121207/34332_1 /TAXON_ID=195067 ORGANISM="Goniomonas pacifica, Strain CCMP1869" /NCGR_SAMPLE_ID=MMETSP0107_2 /ASSEMBLY_ACC=CAM_ASM_000203 /LENGTH=67 /DNA_ID=CAMNT_0017184211 /DNA_START=269 /DNA_END=472 /DNA_ORIENTATION=-